MLKEKLLVLQQQKSDLLFAKILMTVALYVLLTAFLLEYFSVIVSLKTIGFVLCAHAFYFLFRARQG